MLYFCCNIFMNKFHDGVIHGIHKKNISNVKQMHEYCINSIYLLHARRTPLFVLDSVSWTVWVPKVCLLFGWAAVSQDMQSKIHKNNSSGHHKLLRPKSWCQLFMYNSQWCQWKFHEHIWKQMMSFITARENTNQQSPDETWVLSVSLQAPLSCQDYPFTWQSGKITKKNFPNFLHFQHTAWRG